MNQRRCWANDRGRGPCRGTGTRGGASAARAGPPRRLDPGGEVRQRRRLEEVAQRQLDAEGAAQARDHLRRQQRVAAQVEEVVVRPDPLEPEHLGPDAGEDLLDRRARRHDSSPSALCRSGAGRALRSTLPLGVSGSAASVTKAAGTM